MKKTLLALLVILSILPFFANAQWTSSSGDIHNVTIGNVGINTASPAATLDIGGNIQISSVSSTTPSRFLWHVPI